MADSTETHAAALGYVERGWAILALYGVDEGGRCRCARGALCKSPGKHPHGRRRADGGGWLPPMRTAEDLERMLPGDNIGLATGAASDCWALDVDPKHGGDLRLKELETVHGALPDTWKQRTGSGGFHLLFQLPDDFTVTDSPGRLPPGLDVRGEGGQIVLAPSVSGVGAYAVERDAAVLAAPAWLLDLIRPLPISERDVFDGPTYSGVPQLTSDNGLSDVDGRLAAYAMSAVQRELGRLASAVPGTRGRTAFEVACNLIEIANSPWSGLARETLWAAYATAAGTAMDLGGDFDEAEAYQSWSSAARTVGERGRATPQAPGGGEFLPWASVGGVPPFSAGSPASPAGLSMPWAPAAADPFSAPDSSGTSASTSGYPQASADPVDALIGRMLMPDDLRSLPPPEPLVDGLIDLDSEVWMIGPSGGFKTFVALDLACHVSSGRTWQGLAVTQGTVVYVVAEGAKGIKQRVEAWRHVYGDPGRMIVLPEPVQAGRLEEWMTLVEACGRLGAAMVVLDTQARVTVGLNENDARDMGIFVEAVRRMRVRTGAAVVVVHHTGRNGGDARGSSAIDGAQDTEIRVERPSKRSMRAKITTDKQKDRDDRFCLEVTLKVHDVGFDAKGRKMTSLAVAPADPFDLPVVTEPEWIANLTENQGLLLAVMRDHSGDQGATQAEMLRWLKERGQTMPRTSAGTALRTLVEKDLLEQYGVARYRLPDPG